MTTVPLNWIPIQYDGPEKQTRMVNCWPAMKRLDKCIDRSELGNTYLTWLSERHIPFTTSRASGYIGVCKDELVGIYIDSELDRIAFKLAFGL